MVAFQTNSTPIENDVKKPKLVRHVLDDSQFPKTAILGPLERVAAAKGLVVPSHAQSICHELRKDSFLMSNT